MSQLQNYTFQSRLSCYLFVVSLLGIPFITFYTLGFSGLAEPINTLVFIPVSGLFILSAFKIKNTTLAFSSKLTQLLIITFFMLVLTLLLVDFELTNSAVITLCTILFLILVVQNLAWLNIDKNILIYILFVFGCAQLIYGMLEYGNLLPFDGIDHGTRRPVASFRQVNIFATIMVANYFLAVYLYHNECRKLIKNSALVISFLTPIIIFACSSKTSFVSLTLCFLILLFFGQRKFITQNKTIFIFTLCGVITTAILSYFVEPPRSAEQYSNTYFREMIYLHSIDMILQKPLLGWGAGEFIHSFYYSLMSEVNLGNYKPKENMFVTHPHNEVLLWTIEYGLLGLAFIVYLLINLLKMVSTKINIEKSWGLLIAAPILVHSMLEFPVHASSLVSLYLCLVIYCFCDLSESSKIKTQSVAKITAVIQLIYIPVIVLISISAIASAKYTSSPNVAAALKTRPQIILDFPANKYIRQTDLFVGITLARANKDHEQLAKVNNELFEFIKQMPVQKLAKKYIDNCKIIENCDSDKTKFITANFPFSSEIEKK